MAGEIFLITDRISKKSMSFSNLIDNEIKRMHIAIKADEMDIRILNFNRKAHDELLEEAKKRGIELPTDSKPKAELPKGDSK